MYVTSIYEKRFLLCEKVLSWYLTTSRTPDQLPMFIVYLLWMSLFNSFPTTCQTIFSSMPVLSSSCLELQAVKRCRPPSHINTLCLSVPIHISLDTSLCYDSTLAEPKMVLGTENFVDVCSTSQSFHILRPHSVHKITHRSVALLLLNILKLIGRHSDKKIKPKQIWHTFTARPFNEYCGDLGKLLSAFT